MNLNDRQSVINNIYAALREIDSYKYGLVSKEVLLIQSSMLVFTKEGINPGDEICAKTQSYKSYLLNMIWSQVKMYWDGSVENIPSLRSIYNRLVSLRPTSNECAMVLDAILDKNRIEQEDANPTNGLAELAVKLLDYHKGEVVYNPNAGVGAFAQFLDFGNDYFGWTSVSTHWYVGIAKMLLADKVPSENYICTERSSLDVIEYSRYISIFRSREVKYEEVFSGLTPNGKAILIMPVGVLLRPRSKFCEMIIKNNVLDKVIILPSSMLKETGANYAVLVCENSRPQNKHITILDCRGDEYYSVERNSRRNRLHVSKVLSDIEDLSIENRLEVSQQQIAEAKYVIDPSLYTTAHVEIPEGHDVSSFKELTTVYEFRMDQIVSTKEKVVIRASDLEFNTTDFIVNLEQILANEDRQPTGGVLLEKSCVIVAAKNRGISAAYYEFKEGDEIYADTRLWLFEVNESRIDPRYLVSKLRSFEVSTLRSVIQHSYMQSLPITYPSLAEQRRVIEDTIKVSKQSKIRELGLTEEIQRLKNEYKTLIRTKKHNLGTVRGNISATIRQLQKQVEQSSKTGEIDINALHNRVNRLVNYWKELDGRLDRIADENKFKEAEEFSFDGFFKHLESNTLGNFTLSYNLDKATFDSADAKFAINVNPDDFRQVVENIISNAEKHGFRDSQRVDYYINISVYCEESETGEQRVCFLFENNGYPAPEMTNAQFGMSGWHADVKGSKGEGLGGAYISEMTRHFGGGYEAPHSVMDEIGEYSKTRVLIHFPAIIDFNETIHVMKMYAFDTIFDIIYTHIKYEEYDINTCFDITFDPELEVYELPLQDYGYDLKDDGSIYLDENGLPCQSDLPDDIHWINDITTLDDNGKRVVNEEYIRKIVDRMFSRYKERLCFI